MSCDIEEETVSCQSEPAYNPYLPSDQLSDEELRDWQTIKVGWS